MDRDRLPVMMAYGLYLVAVVNGFTMLLGFLIAIVRLNAARGTIYEGHYRNLITVFLVVLGFAVLMIGLAMSALLGFVSAALVPWPANFYGWFAIPFLFPLAWIAWVILGFWYLWRVIGGFLKALEEQPV